MISSIVYNGYTFDNTNADIQNLIGNGMPDIFAMESLKSQQDGGVATGYKYGTRTFGWQGIISAATNALYLAERVELMAALNMQNQSLAGLPMTFNLTTGDVWTMREVRLIGQNFDFNVKEPSLVWNTYKLTFRSTFPFFEADETDEEQQITSFDYGVVVPAPVAAPLTSTTAMSAATDPLSVTNAGSANAFPTFTITGPGVNFTITNRTTGHDMVINHTLLAGETIIIDTQARTVTKGGSNIFNDMSGSWIYMQPGVNSLTFTAQSGTNSNTKLRTVFKDTYIGL